MARTRLLDSVLVLLALMVVGPLTGCATLVKGASQSVTVNTDPQGATCALTREGKQIAAVNSTPGTVSVDKSRKAVAVSCSKPGYQESAGTITSMVSQRTMVAGSCNNAPAMSTSSVS